MAEERKTARNVRVDQIGFVNELVKHYADDLKSSVKVRMLENGVEVAEGDFFSGLLVGRSATVIDPAKFLKLLEKEEITRCSSCQRSASA